MMRIMANFPCGNLNKAISLAKTDVTFKVTLRQ